MSFSDYNAFRVNTTWLMEGAELSGTFSNNTLDAIVALGEERVYHGDAMTAGLRASCMRVSTTLSVTDNAALLPQDLLELSEAYIDGQKPLEIVPLHRLRAFEATGGSNGANVQVCAQDGDTLRFWPAASGDVQISYYKRPTALKDVEWADAQEIARYPAVFTFAVLFEAALFLGFNEKAKVWEARYRQLADGANHSEAMRVYGGGPLRIRAR